MFDRTPTRSNKAVLLFIQTGMRASESEFDEFVNLAQAADVKVCDCIRMNLRKIAARYYVGVGKAQEIKESISTHKACLLIANKNLSPLQERELEHLCQARVLSRSGLILDIFARSAHSHEGKLQVELAQLSYLSTRLVRGWSHLERQKGGIGLRGPGEKQLETDRRLCRQRIKQIKKKIVKIKSQRQLGQQRRHRNNIPTIALVGYTNVGKSALFNRLAQTHNKVSDMPFATLDPCWRRVFLGPGETFILSDTVGFVGDLPPVLIDAFHTTLQSITQAKLLLHVVDVVSPDQAEQQQQVEIVLKTISAAHIQHLTVYNKIDKTQRCAEVLRNWQGVPYAVFVSAHTGEGIAQLKQVIAEILNFSHAECTPQQTPQEDEVQQDGLKGSPADY